MLTRHFRKRALHQRTQYILGRLFRLTVSNCLLTASLSAMNAILLPFEGPLLWAQCVLGSQRRLIPQAHPSTS